MTTGQSSVVLLAICLALCAACGEKEQKPPIVTTDGRLDPLDAADGATAEIETDVSLPDLPRDKPGADIVVPDVPDGETAVPPDHVQGDGAVQEDNAELDVPIDVDFLIPAELLGDICFDFCQKIVECDMTEEFGPQYLCQSDCEEHLGLHPELLSNYSCVSFMKSCGLFDVCWDPQPLPDYPKCSDWCVLLVECGVTGMVNLPDDQGLCTAVCTGKFTPYGGLAVQVIECAISALEDECDLFGLLDCFGGGSNCDEQCAELAGECEPDSEYFDLFPAEEDCVAQCEGYSNQQFLALDVCLSIAGCDAALLCISVPDEPFAGCDDFCIAFLQLCPDTGFSDELCQWACTGSAMGMPDSNPLEAADCVAEMDECPEEPSWLLVGCIAGECSTMCGMAEQCEPWSDYFELYPTTELCLDACNSMNDSQVAATSVCLSAAGCDGALLCSDAPVEPPEGCGVYCDSLTGLCPDIPWFLMTSCEDVCSGLTMRSPLADPASAPECIEQFESCPENLDDVVWGCLAGKCGQMCGYFDVCFPWSDYYDIYPTPEACKQACAALNFGQAQATGVCIAVAQCDGASACQAPPETPPEGCDGYCESLLALCPDATDDFGTAKCQDVCSGIVMAVPDADPDSAPDCLAQYELCPVSTEEASFGCLVKPGVECEELCGTLDDCDIVQEWECAMFCSALKQDAPAMFNLLKLCVDAAQDCQAVAECVED